MATLHDGTSYVPGLGASKAAELRDSGLPAEVVDREVAYLRETYVDSDYAEGFGVDVVVADLIVRGILSNRQVAEALLRPVAETDFERVERVEREVARERVSAAVSAPTSDHDLEWVYTAEAHRELEVPERTGEVVLSVVDVYLDHSAGDQPVLALTKYRDPRDYDVVVKSYYVDLETAKVAADRWAVELERDANIMAGVRTQSRRVTVRAYSREEASRTALAKAFAEWPDRDGVAGPWRSGHVEPMALPEGFEALFARADLSNLYLVDVFRVVREPVR